MRLTSEAETWRRTTRMTARALEGLAELPRDERDAAVEVLREPFFHLRPHKMAQRKDLDLWRVRVNRDVRITYTLQTAAPSSCTSDATPPPTRSSPLRRAGSRRAP